MKSSADAILESLIGEVETSYGGPIDISQIVAKSDTKPRELPPPLLLTESKNESRKRDKKEKKKKEKDDVHKSKKHKDDVYIRTLPREGASWEIEPMKTMPIVDDIPAGADFKLYHPKIKDAVVDEKDKTKEKSKKEKRRSKDEHKSKEEDRCLRDKKRKEKKHKHKSKSEKEHEKDKLGMLPSVLEKKSSRWEKDKDAEIQKEAAVDVEDGEILEGWMAMDPKKSKDFLTPDEIQALEIEKRKKEKKVLKREKDKLEKAETEKKEQKRKEKEEKSRKKKEKEEKARKKKEDEERKKKEEEREKDRETREKEKSRKDEAKTTFTECTSHYYRIEDSVDRDDRTYRSQSRQHSKDHQSERLMGAKVREDDRKSHKDKDDQRDRLDRHREDRERVRSPSLKASGSLVKPLSPKVDTSFSKLLPQTWSKHLNGLLKNSNDEFTNKESRSRHHHPEDIEVRDDELPKRRGRSRSNTPTVGRGRNFFRRTDEEWKEHQRDRIKHSKLRRVSPVQIFEEDYMDRDGRVDKKKLMNIATRNVTKLAMSGLLPKGYELLSTIKNKSINQLVELCNQLHDDDERARADRPSSSSEDEEEERFVGARYWEENKGGFALRQPQEVPKPRYEMIDGVVHQVKTAEERRADEQTLRVSYPVSSGYEHRTKECEPADDDIPDLPLLNALARIKTNIPPAFEENYESQFLALLGPATQLALPAPEPKSLVDQLASISAQKPAIIPNLSCGYETLSKPIEINRPQIPTFDAPKTVAPPVVTSKPVKIRASFLKSGKKAAEEALQKILATEPTPVPAPGGVASTESASQSIAQLLNVVATGADPTPPMVVLVEEPAAIPKSKEVNHADALSALLDRVDRLVNLGKMDEVTVVQRRDTADSLLSPVKAGDYVKIPGLLEAQEKERKKVERLAKKEAKEAKKREKIEASRVNLFALYLEARRRPVEAPETAITGETVTEVGSSISTDQLTIEKPKKKKKREKEKRQLEEGELVDEHELELKKRKKHSDKKRKHGKDDSDSSPKKKRRSSQQLAIEAGTCFEFIGPHKPPTFNLRDPSPFIKALAGPQLAIDAPRSLKAEWNDPKNPLNVPPIYINNDDTIPLPFRIMPPAREPVLKPEDMVFKTSRCITHPPRMINDLLNKRSQFAQALMTNTNDYYAKSRIAEIDREMSAWAESKNIPGKFTGRTGARVLSAEELQPSDPRYNSWARKDLFLNAPEHDSEFGRKIMEKYGWQKGVGLGRTLNGPVEPLKLDIKSDKKGLFAASDRKPGRNAMIADINGKNPISLVMEYTAKHRLEPPTFTCIESGPANYRRFLWKCTVNGTEFSPAMPAGNKKAGKTEVCYVVLQALGQIPPTIPD